MRDNISTCREITSLLWRVFNTLGDTFSIVEGVQYFGGYLQYCGDCSVQWEITSVQWGIASVLWRVFSTLGVPSEYMWGITSVQWGITSVLWRVFSTVGEDFKFRHVWPLKTTKRYRHFLYYETKFSFGSFENSSRFHAFLELDWCTPGPTLFRNNDYFIFGMLYLSFKFNCLCDCFLTLSIQLQIHENAIEIVLNLKEDFMQRRKVPIRLWIIKITYLTGRTNKLQRILPRA